jgi:hypothetical protein
MRHKTLLSAAAVVAVMATAPLAMAQNNAPSGSATAGSAGTASVGGQNATTLGVGAVSNTPTTSSQAIGMGAAAAGDNVKTRSAVHGNLNGNAMAMAHDGGTMAKSHTVCHDGNDSVACRTKTMTHEPGSKPAKSSSTGSATIQ